MPAVNRLLRRRVLWSLIGSLAIVAAGSPSVAGSGNEAGTFSLVATHPEAAAYPTIGNSLVGLTPWQGKLYMGYGHWVNFTGLYDFAIRAYDPATTQLVRPWVTRAEAVWNYRPIGTKLYAPLTDPSDRFDYVVAEPWQNNDPISDTRRVFDIVTLNGSDLFMVGAAGLDAVVWRSIDGGQTWQESLRVGPQDSGDLETHFSFALVYNGRIYVQAFGVGVGGSGAFPTSKVFNGTTWGNGPNLLPNYLYKGWKPTPFAGKIVYLSGDPANVSPVLLVFDGVQATPVPTTFHAWDFFVSDGYLYALAADPGAPTWAPVVRRTNDLSTWTDVAVPPTDSRSIGTLQGYLYVGAREGLLYRYSDPIRRCRQPSRRISVCRQWESSV